MKYKAAWVGLVVVGLAATQASVRADLKTKAATKAVSGLAKAGMEEAVKDAALNATLEAVLPDVPGINRIDDIKDGRGPVLDSAAGQGIEGAMKAADLASSVENAIDVAEAAKKVNKVRKVVR